MDDVTYQHWWQLHLRVAKGEKLNLAEQTEYEAGLEALDREEKSQRELNDLAMLRRLRAWIEQLQTVHSQLLATSVRLDQQIAILENAYRALTGYELAGEHYASS